MTAAVDIIFTEEFDWTPGTLMPIDEDGTAHYVNTVPFLVNYNLDTSASGPFQLVVEANGQTLGTLPVLPGTGVYSWDAPMVPDPTYDPSTGGSQYLAQVDVRLEGPEGTVASDSDSDNSVDSVITVGDWFSASPLNFPDVMRPNGPTSNFLTGLISDGLEDLIGQYGDEQYQLDPLGEYTDTQIEELLRPLIPDASGLIIDEAYALGVAAAGQLQDNPLGKLYSAILKAHHRKPWTDEDVQLCQQHLVDMPAGSPAALALTESLIMMDQIEQIDPVRLEQWFGAIFVFGSLPDQREALRQLTLLPSSRLWLRNRIATNTNDPIEFKQLAGQALRERADATQITKQWDFMSQQECQETLQFLDEFTPTLETKVRSE